MGIKFEKIKNLNINDIYIYLQPMLEKISNNFKFLDLTPLEYEQICLKAIKNSIDTFKADIPYEDYISKILKKELCHQTEQMLMDNDKTVKIVSKIINTKFKESIDYKKSYDNLIILKKFLNKYKFVPDPNVIEILISKNQHLEDSLAIIVSEKLDIIQSGLSEEIFDDSIVVMFVEVYCMLKNIEIKNAWDNFEDILDSKEILDDENNLGDDSDKEDLNENSKQEENDFNTLDIIKTYLKEVGKIPLLTIEEEKDIGYRILKGDKEAKKKIN